MDPGLIVVNIIGLSAVLMVGLFLWDGPSKKR
jgi:hypothetical protein